MIEKFREADKNINQAGHRGVCTRLSVSSRVEKVTAGYVSEVIECSFTDDTHVTIRNSFLVLMQLTATPAKPECFLWVPALNNRLNDV